MKTLTTCLAGLCLGGTAARGATIETGDVNAVLGPDFFINAAATGGGNYDAVSADFIRDFGVLPIGSFGSLITITGMAWASPASDVDAGSATVTITYLGADGAIGGGDDVLLGSTSDSLNYTGADEYVWVFDSPISGIIDGVGGNFLINVTGDANIRYKQVGGAVPANVKLSVAGTAVANDLTDGDNDGLPDDYEDGGGVFVDITMAGTDPAIDDTDGDNLLDGEEVFGHPVTGYTSDPNKQDTDGDMINDDVENSGALNISYGMEPTDPGNPDTDGDGLPDGDEINLHGTDPNDADTDFDTIPDGEEVLVYGTDPLEEDSDEDGLPDDWEIANELDPTSSEGDDGALGDPDGDLLSNDDEYNAGLDSSDPQDSDTDNDGLDDRFEYDSTGLGGFLSLLNRDTDNDGLSDKFEVDNGLDPLADANFDNDVASDFDEVMIYGSDPKDDTSFPGDTVAADFGGFTPIVKYGTVFGGQSLPLPPLPEDPASLGSAIVNEAVQGGGDFDYFNGITDFTTVYSDIFPVAGTEVSISGFAWVVTSINNLDGDILLEFYDPEAADGDPDFDGVDQETLVGTAKGTFVQEGGTGVYYWAFDTPVAFTSAGTSLAVRILGTESMRFKLQTNVSSGYLFSNQGDGMFPAERTINFTLFGTAVSPAGPRITNIARAGDALTILFTGTPGSAGGFTVTGSPDLETAFDVSGVSISSPIAEGATGEYSVTLDVSANGAEYFFRIEE